MRPVKENKQHSINFRDLTGQGEEEGNYEVKKPCVQEMKYSKRLHQKQGTKSHSLVKKSEDVIVQLNGKVLECICMSSFSVHVEKSRSKQ